MFRWVHPQFSKAEQTFQQDRKNKIKEMEEYETERANRQKKITADPRWVSLLLEKQRLRPGINWKNPKFERNAVRERREAKLKQIEQDYTDEELLYRLHPSVLDFASYIAMFEHPLMAPTPEKSRERVVAAIVELVLSHPSIEVPLALGSEVDAQFSPKKVWDLFRTYNEARLLLEEKIQDQIRGQLAWMAEDRRSREKLVAACKLKHGIPKEAIAKAAGVAKNDFYKWQDSNPEIGPKKSRRIVFAVLSPIWPPPQLPKES